MKPRNARVKTGAALVSPAQTRDEAAAMIGEIGRAQRERARIQAAMGDEIAEIKARYEAEALVHNDVIRTRGAAVQAWCEANRALLTGNGKSKTAIFVTGEVRWRVTPPRVVVRAADIVLGLLRERGLTRFLRVKEEVNREAILADPEAVAGVPGIRIEQTEEFVIVPTETTLEEVP